MYEANFEFNTNTIEFDSEINTKNIQANLILNVTPDRTSQLINDSDYATNAALSILDERIEEINTNKQDVLTAGANIQINNNIISATDTSAKWGNIQGTLSNQTDLQNALNNKYDASNPNGYITSANIGNGTLTIQKNGINVATFGANQSGNVTANIVVPTTATEIGALPSTTTINDLTSAAQQAALNSGVTTSIVTQVGTNATAITTINSLIPSSTTASNPLTNEDFVNSSIATNTAYFIGTFNSVAELEAYSGTLTNNDYAFVVTTDSVGNTAYDRYKYNADTQEWLFEYELNNSSFTAEQWAAINSGANEQNVSAIASNTVNSYNNGTSFCDVYSDGKCIQGGIATGGTTNSGVEILFLKPFADDNYLLLASGLTRSKDNFGTYAVATAKVRNLSTTSFYASTSYRGASSSGAYQPYQFSWLAIGKIGSSS